MNNSDFLIGSSNRKINSRIFFVLKTALLGAVLFIFPQITLANSIANINVPISSEGVIPGFTVICATASSTGATQYLVRSDSGEPLYKSYGVLQRVPCVDGIASFDSVNLDNRFNSSLAGIPYEQWSMYYSFPQQMFVKDTTGLCFVLCNLFGAFNNYNLGSMLPNDTTWQTLGEGPAVSYDGSVWSSSSNGSTTPVATGLSNVLFLPGLEASRLYIQKEVLGLGVEDQLWESNKKADVEDLYLNQDGTSKNSGIYTRDSISETNTLFTMGALGQNIYKSFFAMLDSLTDSNLPQEKRMVRWEAYAYDWRYGVDDIVKNGTTYQIGQKSLITTLQNLVASSTTGKVTIVAHSNGGLLAKALMVKLQQMKDAGTSDLIDHIDTLILVASPQIGTASAVPALLHGYDQRMGLGILLNEEHARELGRNMPGGYGLLPSREYINRVDTSPITFEDNSISSGITTDFVNTYGTTTDSYSEYKNFLVGAEGRTQPSIADILKPISLTSNLFAQSETLHNAIDSWIPPVSMRVVEVAGWGLDTVASFKYYPKLTGCGQENTGCTNPYILDEKPIFTVDGDKTVVEPSAHYMDATAMNTEKYWVDINRYNGQILGGFRHNREHKDILEIDSLNNLIKSVISKTDIVLDSVLKNTKPIDTKNRLRMSIHSPVSIGAYDPSGNFTGKVCLGTEDFCYIQEDISNSSYVEFGEGKYINAPKENIDKIVLDGAGIGTFTFESENVAPEGSSIISIFKDIPVTTQTQGEVVFDSSAQPQLKLDVTGDGVFDFILEPTPEFDPVVFLQIMKKTIESFDIKQSRKNTLSKRIDGIIKSIQKGKILKAKLKAEKFQGALEKKTEKPLPKKSKPQKLTNVDAEILIGMLEKLLDNLEK